MCVCVRAYFWMDDGNEFFLRDLIPRDSGHTVVTATSVIQMYMAIRYTLPLLVVGGIIMNILGIDITSIYVYI